MKRYLLGILLALITLPSNAAWHIYPDDGCAILPWVFPAHWGNDDYYFCGAHKTSCNNDNASDNEVKKSTYWYEHGKPATLNNERYWCCGGKVTSEPKNKNETAKGTPGKWVKGADWIVNTEPVTEDVGGGKCTYLVTTDICGNKDYSEKDTVCKAQIKDNIKCPDGQHYRASNGTCATLCKTDYAFESKESNRCVECSETSTRGIVSASGDKTDINIPPMDRICKTCPAATSIFDPETRECISKNSSQLTALSTTELQYGRNGRTRNAKPVSTQCWTKFGTEYKDCVLNNK